MNAVAGRRGSGCDLQRYRSAAGPLIRSKRPQDIELVAIRIGHDHPADLPLADVDPAGTQGLQPGDLGGLVTGPQIQVQPVLDDLALRYLQEQQVGDDAILPAPLRRLENDLAFLLERPPPAERRLPEGSDLGRVTGIDAQTLDAYIHAPTLIR